MLWVTFSIDWYTNITPMKFVEQRQLQWWGSAPTCPVWRSSCWSAQSVCPEMHLHGPAPASASLQLTGRDRSRSVPRVLPYCVQGWRRQQPKSPLTGNWVNIWLCSGWNSVANTQVSKAQKIRQCDGLFVVIPLGVTFFWLVAVVMGESSKVLDTVKHMIQSGPCS